MSGDSNKNYLKPYIKFSWNVVESVASGLGKSYDIWDGCWKDGVGGVFSVFHRLFLIDRVRKSFEQIVGCILEMLPKTFGRIMMLIFNRCCIYSNTVTRRSARFPLKSAAPRPQAGEQCVLNEHCNSCQTAQLKITRTFCPIPNFASFTNISTPLVFGLFGLSVFWSFGLVAFWSFGVLVFWPLVFWHFDMLAQLLNLVRNFSTRFATYEPGWQLLNLVRNFSARFAPPY